MRSHNAIPDDLRARARRNGHAPHMLTAADLLEMELPEVSYVVPDILPAGVTILGGKPKTGKSWMALGVAIAVASGGVALGTKAVEEGDALFLALEDNPRRMQKRLRKLLADDTAPSGLTIAFEWPRLDAGGVKALDGWLKEHDDARLVVVDVLKKIRPRAGRNQTIYDADYEALEELVPVAAKHGVAILVLHHLRKLDADDPLDTISGSTGLSGGVDGVLILKRDRGRADAYLHIDGRDVEEPAELALRWDAEVAGWAIAGEAEEYRGAELRAAIRGVLEKNGEPMTPTEVADALGKSPNTLKQRMWHMSRDGELASSEGRYTLPGVPRNPDNPVTDKGS
jgi:hypothetical protein